MNLFSRRDRLPSELVEGMQRLGSELFGPATFDERMERLCFRMRTLLKCDRVSVFLREGEHYRARFNSGNPPDIARVFASHRVRLDDPLVSRAVTTRRPVAVNQASRDPLISQRLAEAARIRAIVVAPLLDADHEALGFVTAEFNETRARFRRREVDFFEGLAGIVSLAVVAGEAENARRRSEAELQAASHLAALGRFASGLAHDLGNRTTAVVALAELIAMRHPQRELAAELLELVEAVEATARLSRQLLNMTAEDRTVGATCDVAFVFRSIEAFLRPLVPSNVDLYVDVMTDAATIPISALELSRIVSNLVLNAVDACLAAPAFEHGANHGIWLRVDRADALEAEDGPPQILVEVEDDGEGIERAEIEKVFEPSHTTRPQGRGLGLWIVRTLVADAGGSVSVRSKPGAGSTFRVVFPECRPPGEPRFSLAPPRRSGPQRVLVVDDDEPVRRLVKRSLEMHGHEVFTAANAEDALETLPLLPPIDVLVSDIVMPGMNGIDLALEILRETPIGSVIFVSAQARPTILDKREELRDARFVAKPFSPSKIVRELESLVASNSPAH